MVQLRQDWLPHVFLKRLITEGRKILRNPQHPLATPRNVIVQLVKMLS